MTSYFKFGDITIKVPEKMIVDDKQGNPLLKDTLTKSGNLSTYLGHKSIQIKDVANLERVKIVTDQPAYKEYVKPAVKKRGRKPKPTPTPEPELNPREIFNSKYLPFIQKLNDEGIKFDKGIPYGGADNLDFLIYLYFSKKYNLKHCFNELIERSYYNILVDLPVSSHKREIKRMLECIEDIQNIEQDIVFMPLTIEYKVGGSHANFFMYKKSTSEIIHYDPHGTIKEKDFFIEFVNELNIMNFSENKKYYTTRLKLVESEELCPVGLQELENISVYDKDIKKYKNEGGGWCMMWAYFTFELIAMGEDIKYNVIVQLINEKTIWNMEGDDFRYVDIIRGYINHIYNELKPLVKEIFDVTITTNKEMYNFYNDKMRQKKYSKIIDKIVDRPWNNNRLKY